LKRGICYQLLIRMSWEHVGLLGGFFLPLSSEKKRKGVMLMSIVSRSIGKKLNRSWLMFVMILWLWLMIILFRILPVNLMCSITKCRFIFLALIWFCFVLILLLMKFESWMLLFYFVFDCLVGKAIIIVIWLSLRVVMRGKRLLISPWKHIRYSNSYTIVGVVSLECSVDFITDSQLSVKGWWCLVWVALHSYPFWF